MKEKIKIGFSDFWGGFNYDPTSIPIPETDRMEMLFRLKFLICILNTNKSDIIFSPRILTLLNDHPEDMSSFKYFNIINGDAIDESSLQIMKSSLNKEFGTLSDRNIHELSQEIYCNMDKVSFNAHVLKYESEMI